MQSPSPNLSMCQPRGCSGRANSMCVCVCVDAKSSLATVAFQAARMRVPLSFSYRLIFSLPCCLPSSPILNLITSPSCRPHAKQIRLILRMIQILHILWKRCDLPAVSRAPGWVRLGMVWFDVLGLHSGPLFPKPADCLILCKQPCRMKPHMAGREPVSPSPSVYSHQMR